MFQAKPPTAAPTESLKEQINCCTQFRYHDTQHLTINVSQNCSRGNVLEERLASHPRGSNMK